MRRGSKWQIRGEGEERVCLYGYGGSLLELGASRELQGVVSHHSVSGQMRCTIPCAQVSSAERLLIAFVSAHTRSSIGVPLFLTLLITAEPFRAGDKISVATATSCHKLVPHSTTC